MFKRSADSRVEWIIRVNKLFLRGDYLALVWLWISMFYETIIIIIRIILERKRVATFEYRIRNTLFRLIPAFMYLKSEIDVIAGWRDNAAPESPEDEILEKK